MKKYQSPADILHPLIEEHCRTDDEAWHHPEDVLEKLEYFPIIQHISNLIKGEPAREIIKESRPSTNQAWIQNRLDETEAMKQLLAEGHSFPLSQFRDISGDLFKLQVEGSRLSPERILGIATVVDQSEAMRRQSSGSRTIPLALHPEIQSYWELWPDLSEIGKSVAQLFDREGNIRSDASERLVELEHQKQSIKSTVDQAFRSILKKYRDKGWLSEAPETIRKGRKVLSVPSEHKGKVKGIVHDQSSTGKTTFIEPQSMIDANNQLVQVEQKKRREAYRLITALCDKIHNRLTDIVDGFRRLVALDLIQARARFALKIGAERPRLREEAHLRMKEARHPLLYLHHLDTDRPTVPSDITLYGRNRILLLSGPNAGGKSVALKTAGLLQLMVQSGWLVPADSDSTFGVFNRFFVDMGDQQSLEDDLSTYSSHLANLNYFLEQADSKSLLLLDELGAGTDPKLGGAMAESILHQLKKKSAYGVVTTHYSNLKVYAFREKGIVNGALVFDEDELRPTFELRIGKPGSSYAFELAERNGIPPHLIDRAKKNAGKDLTALEDLVVELQNEKSALEKKLQYTRELEHQLDQMRKNFDHLHRQMEIRRKKLKLRQKEVDMREKADARQMLEEKINEWSEEERKERAKEELREINEHQEELGKEVRKVKDELFEREESPDQGWKKGDFVKSRDGTFTGQIQSIQNERAQVRSGGIKLNIPLRDLRSAKEPMQRNHQSNVNTELSRQAGSMGRKLDLRGLRRKEALKIFEKFMEDALMADKSDLKIIHGRGEGVLRKAIHEKIREYGSQHILSHPDEEHGGDGVTLIKLQ